MGRIKVKLALLLINHRVIKRGEIQAQLGREGLQVGANKDSYCF